jgi:hypothetical protein
MILKSAVGRLVGTTFTPVSPHGVPFDGIQDWRIEGQTGAATPV